MSEQILSYMELCGAVIRLFAVALIIAGFILAGGRYVLRYSRNSLKKNFEQFKIELGSAIILGLEILILGDVIETITVDPTFQSLGVLALLIVARTIISWTLLLEIEGHWPWQTSAENSGGEEGHA